MAKRASKYSLSMLRRSGEVREVKKGRKGDLLKFLARNLLAKSLLQRRSLKAGRNSGKRNLSRLKMVLGH